MDTINQKDILKHSKNSTSLQQVTQQSLRGLVLFLLFLGVSCSDSTSSGPGNPLGVAVENPVTELEFNSNSREYGKVTTTSGSTNNLTYEIVDSSAVGGIEVNSQGTIRIVGLVPGTYTFRVQVTDEDTGVTATSPILSITINKKKIDDRDFFLRNPDRIVLVVDEILTNNVGYTETTYATIDRNGPITIDFSIANINPAGTAITVENNNTIKIPLGLAEGTYTFQLVATGTGNYEGIVNRDLELVVEQ